MIKELAGLSGIDVKALHSGVASDASAQNDLVTVISDLAAATSGPLPVDLWFQSRPNRIDPTPQGLNLKVETPDGPHILHATSIISAIGFASNGSLNRDDLLTAAADPISPAERLYTIGWFREGPVGAIAQCRSDAQSLAKRIVSEITHDPQRKGNAIFAELPDVVGFDHWEHIDSREISAAPENRCRQKISNMAELLRPLNS
jgi:ferredoxin--NADP+ reductase